MIFTLLIEALISLVIFIVSLLPSLNFELSVDFSALANVIGYIDTLISFSILLACIAATIIFDNFSFLMKILKFILSKFGLG
ncbi:hypothetical protein IGJ83_001520 [Enterococcus pernyi]